MKKNKRLVVSIFVMLLFIVVISMIFIFVSKKDNTVVDNVEIMKIDVSNKTYINGVVEPLETENIYLDG